MTNELFISNLKGVATAELYDLGGRLISRQEVYNNKPIDLNAQSGVYYLKVISEGVSEVKKLIIK